MRLRTLLVTTAILAATAPGVSAQTGPSSPVTPKNDSTAMSRPRSGPAALRKKANRSALPPPPTVPLRPSRHAVSSSRAAAGTGMVGMDTSGRKDKAGRQVGFYPTVRGRVPVGTKESALGNRGSSAPRENPQKNPYKMPGS